MRRGIPVPLVPIERKQCYIPRSIPNHDDDFNCKNDKHFALGYFGAIASEPVVHGYSTKECVRLRVHGQAAESRTSPKHANNFKAAGSPADRTTSREQK